MRSIISWSLQFRLLVVAVGALVMVAGISQLRQLPVDAYPEFSPPYVEIQTEALGLSAEEVEQLITVPLEADLLNGVAWLDEIRSESIPGLSRVLLTFEPGTDLMRARQMVQERLTQAHALPNVSKPPAMLQPLSSTSRVMMIGLSSNDLSLIEMSVLARWTIRPRLMGVPGVANVAIWGQRKRQLQVHVDPEQLRDRGVSLDQVIRTAGDALWLSPLSFLNASLPGTGGFIDTPNQRLGVRHVLPITSAAELAQVAVHGAALSLGDVASVVENHQPLIGDALVGGEPGLLLVVEKFPWAGTVEVTAGLDKALGALRPAVSGMEMDARLFRQANFIELATGNIGRALLIGATLALIALLALLYSWRSMLISLVAISMSLTAAALVLYLRGGTINAMVFAGLMMAVAVIVDDAVLSVKGILERLRAEPVGTEADRSRGSLVLAALLERRNALGFATMIIILSVTPLFFLEGLFGAFFKPLALSYVVAVLVSTAVALTITPALTLLLFARRGAGRETSVLVNVRRAYDKLLARTLQAPRAVTITLAVTLLAGLLGTRFLQLETHPPVFKDTELVVRWEGPPGTTYKAMRRAATQATSELRAIPGVRHASAHVGRAVMSDEVVNVNAAEIWVSLDPTAAYESTMALIGEVATGYPGISGELLTYPEQRLADHLPGSDQQIVVGVYGQNLKVLRAKAREIAERVAGIDGVTSTQVERQIEEPVLEIEVNLTAARHHGIKPGDVRRAAAALLSGIEVGMLFEEQKVFDVVVWGVPSTRHSVSSVRDLLIDTPTGGHVRLEEVADVRVVPAANVIKREGVQRRVDVLVAVKGQSLASVARAIEDRIETIGFPLEYHAEVLGEHEDQRAARNRLLSVAIAAVIGVFLLLQAAFGSWRLAVVVFLSLPAALAGGVIANLVTGASVSIGSFLGFLVLLGITARQGIVLIHACHDLEDGGAPFGPEAIRRGAGERVVPILTSAVTVGLLLLPFVLLGNVAGHEIVHPMAVVVLGGLITSTLLNLLLVPALYLRFGLRAEPHASIVEHGTTPRPVMETG